ncbi:MAG: VTT domain-containing protein [Acidobacteria bacterium]|nr:VTT domain-containing protein [Acidobacteriota bacterium]
MRSLVAPLLGYFLTPVGLILLGALDSSLIFFLPLGIDFVLIVLSAREPEMFWAHALAATAGSVVGAAGTFWLGRTAGEAGLARWVGRARLERIQARVTGKAAAAIACLGLIPPPFPFTAIVLASGAFGVDMPKFLAMLAAVRLTRFGLEAALAARYGQRILVWMDSTVFDVLVGVFIALALVGTVASAVSVLRGTRDRR